MKRLFALIFLATTLSGCMWGRMQMNDPSIVDRAKAIKPGVTTAVEVPRILGAPPMVRMLGKDAHYYNYTFGDTKNEGLMLIILNFSRTSSYNSTLSIEIDPATQVVREVYLPKVPELEWRFWPFD